MKYPKKIYGKIEIDEPIILELINSPELQRLKAIDQAGYYAPYFPGSEHSRFEHSIGVYLLLKKFKAPLKEQIAGLLHDISHSAFSHAIDYVLNEGSEKKQSHQDNYFKKYFLNSNIPKILQKYGFKANSFLNEKNFPLLETKLPDLCADRIDYFLQDSIAYKVISPKKAKEILSKLTIEKLKWVFKDFPSAYEYAQLFKITNESYCASLTTAVMFRRVGNYLKYALNQKYICKKDLYTTDKKVIKKINKNLKQDKRLTLLWEEMNNRAGYENNPDDFDVKTFCKSRVVDPLCWHNGKIKRVSEIAPEWKEILNQESKPKEYFIKFKKD